ncbi:autotransporter outer membrane beta-barrel domain-containing protein [Microvirga sp. GCM10011540]|uniref:autotransporter family protein n=1 Tax=Microvirga sp. GCM10011540 TaxID=3317338 RepID=UPI00360E8AAA
MGRAPRAAGQFRNPLSPGNPDVFGLHKDGIRVPALQGSPGPGDSGGPLFLITEDGLVQIGTVIGTPGNPVTGDSIPGYGIVDDWTPVQLFLDWIAQNNPLRQVVSSAGSYRWSDRSAWTDTQTGEGARPDNRLGGFRNLGQPGRYYDVVLNAASSITVDMNPTVDAVTLDHAQARLTLPSGRVLTTVLGARILDGTAEVNGTLNAPLVDLYGGALTGSGTIAGDLLNAVGIVAPGRANGFGRLTVGGSFRQLPEGVLRLRIDSTGSDSLAVAGEALLGGTLALAGSSDGVDTGRDYTLVTANGGVTGRFARVTPTFVFFDSALVYRPDQVSVSFARNDKPFTAVAADANDTAVAVALAGLDAGNPLYRAFLNSTSAVDAQGARDLLAGEAHASAVTTAYGDASHVKGAILNRLRTPFAAPAATVPAAFAADRPGVAPHMAPMPYPTLDPRRFALWGQGFGAWGNARATAQAAGFDTTTGGFIVGAETTPDVGYRIGIAGGFTHTTFDIAARSADGTNESVFGAIYGAADWGALSLRLGASYAGHDIDVTRRISFPGFADQAGASYGGSTAQAFGEIGYRLNVAGIAVEPFLGASILRVNTDGFAETGGAAALTGASRSHELGTTTLGVRAEAAVSPELPLTLHGTIGWRHAYGDVEPGALLTFRGAMCRSSRAACR